MRANTKYCIILTFQEYQDGSEAPSPPAEGALRDDPAARLGAFAVGRLRREERGQASGGGGSQEAEQHGQHKRWFGLGFDRQVHSFSVDLGFKKIIGIIALEIKLPFSPLTVIKTEENSMVFVKDADEDYEDYAGSTDDEDYTAIRWVLVVSLVIIYYCENFPDNYNPEINILFVRRRNNRTNNATPAPPTKVVDFQGTAVFILALLHALDCG